MLLISSKINRPIGMRPRAITVSAGHAPKPLGSPSMSRPHSATRSRSLRRVGATMAVAALSVLSVATFASPASAADEPWVPTFRQTPSGGIVNWDTEWHTYVNATGSVWW